MTPEEKTAFNARAKSQMQDYLRSKSWVEKVESIQRMNVISKMAREAMRNAKRLNPRSTSSDTLIVHPEEPDPRVT